MTCNRLASRPGEVEILLAALCYRNRDKLRQLCCSRLQGFTLQTHMRTGAGPVIDIFFLRTADVFPVVASLPKRRLEILFFCLQARLPRSRFFRPRDLGNRDENFSIFWFCFLNFIMDDRAKISYVNRPQNSSR